MPIRLYRRRVAILQLVLGALAASCLLPHTRAAFVVPLSQGGIGADPSTNYQITGMFQLDDDGGSSSCAACSCAAPMSSHSRIRHRLPQREPRN